MALFFSGVFTVINTVRVKRWDLIFGSPGNRGPGPLTFALVIALSTLYETISFSDTDTFVSNIV